MNMTERSQNKNAPLTLPPNRDAFVSWASEQPDGGIAAGFQPLDVRLAVEAPKEVLRASAAKLVSLLRRERSQTPEQLAASAAVRIADVLALEHGERVSAEAVGRVAVALHLSSEVLVQLMGFGHAVDQTLIRAAMEFISRLEPAEPLDKREADALRGFRSAVLSRRPSRAEAG